MKGVCRIELRNADGSIAQKTEDNNMVTNYLKNLMNPNYEILMNTLEIEQQFPVRKALVPLIDRVIGGLLLFGENLEEDVNYKIPKSKIIGHAASTYNFPGDATLGVFNAAESNIIHNGNGVEVGYKFVWDFPTDRANGTIKCAALTTGLCGTTGGVKQTEEKINVSQFNSFLVSSSSRYVYQALNAFETRTGKNLLSTSTDYSADYIAYYSEAKLYDITYEEKNNLIGVWGEDYIYVENMKGSNITFSKKRNVKQLSLAKTIGKVGNNQDVVTSKTITFDREVFKYAQSGCAIYAIYAFIDTTDEYINISHVLMNEITIYHIDPSTLELVKTDRYPLARNIRINDTYLYPNRFQGACLYKGYLYTVMQTGEQYNILTNLVKININDTNDITVVVPITKQNEINQFYNVGYSVYGDVLFIEGYFSNLCIQIYNNEIIYQQNGSYTGKPIHYDGLNFPYMATIKPDGRNYSTAKQYLGIGVYNAGLITIDNLATPVIKTSTQTMKITYEITDAE